ncbi:MAG: hypothetical protein ACM33B_07470 [Pseudomonadota bacterium]
MRRLAALALAVVAYTAMALFSPETATLPAGVALVAAASLLAARPHAPRDEAERIALELLRSR